MKILYWYIKSPCENANGNTKIYRGLEGFLMQKFVLKRWGKSCQEKNLLITDELKKFQLIYRPNSFLLKKINFIKYISNKKKYIKVKGKNHSVYFFELSSDSSIIQWTSMIWSSKNFIDAKSNQKLNYPLNFQ